MQHNRFAAIDIGTNTFHLIIAELIEGNLKIVHKENHPVKLGEDLLKENKIIPAAMDRALQCLFHFKEVLEDYGVGRIKTTATSAVRTANNGQLFIDVVKAQIGISIEPIDGNTEAQLIYEAVKFSGVIKEPGLIMDIGGGSTEFIFCDDKQYYWKQSFEIGASKLMQQFFYSDPINESDKQALYSKFEEVLQPLLDYGNKFTISTLIGSAGAFETFALMTEEDIEQPGGALSLEKYRQLSKRLVSSIHEQRTLMPQLIPLRVDMIVMACLLTDYVIEKFQISNLKFSTYDLKIGSLLQLQKE